MAVKLKDDNRQSPRFQDRVRGAFVRYAVILVLIPFIAVVFFALFFADLARTSKANEALDAINEDFCSLYRGYIESTLQIQQDPNFLAVLNGTGDTVAFKRSILPFLNQSGYLRVYFLLGKDRGILHTNARYKEMEAFQFLNSRMLFDILDSNVNGAESFTFYDWTSQQPVNIVGKAIHENGVLSGYLVFMLNNEELLSMLEKHPMDVAYVTDRFDNVIISAGNEKLKNSWGKFVWQKNNRDYYVLEKKLDAGMHAGVGLSRGASTMMLQMGGVTLVFLAGTMVLMLLLLSSDLSKKLTRETEALVKAVKKLAMGDLDYIVPEGEDSEFLTIAQHLNNMTRSLRELNVKNSELSELNRRAEVKQLEMQFNPHFIYNTLETVKVMAYMDQDKAADIIQRLSRVLRFSANPVRTMVTVEEDFGYIEDYLYIQGSRFEDALRYEVVLEEAVKACLVPKLIIHPLVENSIKHGLQNQKVLHVTISAEKQGNDVLFTVLDDGVPISAETRVLIYKTLQSDTPPSAHIGVYNINRRLMLMYGEGYGLDLAPAGSPNSFTVRIPFRQWGDEYD